MSDSFIPDEPAVDPLADTGPCEAVRLEREARTGTQRVLGLFSLAGATVLTLAAVFVMMVPGAEPGVPERQPTNSPDIIATFTPQPEQEQPAEDTTIGEPVDSFTVLPTMDVASMAQILNTPLQPVQNSPYVDFESVRDIYNPFTIVPERTRSGVEPYTIVSGDTIFTIAERYGLKPETIVWGNDHSIVEGLRPGRTINILPVDGVYHQVLEEETIAQVAARYQVDPYAIIDSEFNDLFGFSPDSPLPAGAQVVVPGGQREQIAWNPVVERVAGTGASGSNGAISFAPGEAGSCGLVTNPGGTAWARPIGGYQWIRGFSGVHSGVDLSAPAGSPVFAANGGAVIFAGWNSYGYGYTVVLAHGPYTTLYGHLSAINVGCAQYVSPGQTIGAVGSTGNSSGPHLHFEIRYLDMPQDPTYTMPF